MSIPSQAPAALSPAASRSIGLASIATAIAGVGYAVSFVIVKDALLSALFLLLGGVLATPVLVAVRERLRDTAPVASSWAILLAIAGALGSAVHGGYDLANAVHPPAVVNADLPNPVDPRGLLTFGLAGVAVLVLGLLIARSGALPRWLGYLACLNGALLVLLYLGRLLILDPTSLLIVIPALLTGFALNPLWYAWLGVWFLRARRSWQGQDKPGAQLAHETVSGVRDAP
jgi:hypothetical protein